MPLQGGVCAFDPEHTPLPQDLDDPELPDWFSTWLHNYQRRSGWHFSVFGPLPPIIAEDIADLKLAPVPSTGACGIPASTQRHPGTAIWGGKPLCPECLMPLQQHVCSLDPGHDVSHPVYRETRRTAPIQQDTQVPIVLPASRSSLPADGPASSRDVELQQGPTFQGAGLDVSQLPKTIESWLREMDAAGFLAPYHDTIAGHFDSPAQIIDIYVRCGNDGQHPVLDPRFMDDMQIRKLGHRRLFEKWFADRLGTVDTLGIK